MAVSLCKIKLLTSACTHVDCVASQEGCLTRTQLIFLDKFITYFRRCGRRWSKKSREMA